MVVSNSCTTFNSLRFNNFNAILLNIHIFIIQQICHMCTDDFNRIVLSTVPNVDNSDYINASYVDVSSVHLNF